jgi:hypothetical protein
VTDLSQRAVPLTIEDLRRHGGYPVPSKLVLVFGTEAVGCSKALLDGADLRVYLELSGFAESLNLSVAAALVIHRVLTALGHQDGNNAEERDRLRRAWYPKVARSRLLTAKQKRHRKKLQQHIRHCERIAALTDHDPSPEQAAKLSNLERYQRELAELEAGSGYSDDAACAAAVQEWIERPPEPLSDLRRADEHRVTWVGRNTRRLHRDHWRGLAAVATTRQRQQQRRSLSSSNNSDAPPPVTTGSVLRRRVQEQQLQQQQQQQKTEVVATDSAH